MPPDDDPEDTLQECKACGGHWSIRAPDGTFIACRWCSAGFMNDNQFKNWMAHKSGPRKLTPGLDPEKD